jgi:anti-sigma B factor antagonist
MANAALEASAHSDGPRARIDLRGDIDASARETLAAAYEATAATRELLLDFTAVDYINSTGIALIVGLLAHARADARSISACGLSPHYREIFEITRLSDFMTILADERTQEGEQPDE